MPDEASPVPWFCTTTLNLKISPGPSELGFAPGGWTTRSDCPGACTVTAKRWLAVRPSGSVAVTVMVAVPTATAVAVTELPDSATEAAAGFEDTAV